MIGRMRLSWEFSGKRMGFAANLVVSVFLFVSAVMPYLHHSFDCHVKSLTHCRACTVASGAKAPHAQILPAAVSLNDAGAVVASSSVPPEFLSLCQSSDRAPPAIG
jgi:hypothetical protein